MVIVWGSIEAREDTLQEICALSIEHVARSRTEPGCISHSVQSDLENPNRLIFFEEWSDMDALQAHFRVPASNAFVQQVSALAAGAPEMKMFDATAL